MHKVPLLIFLVDDDPVVLKLIESVLTTMKYKVVSFSYGEECLEQMYLKPDLIILDYIFFKKDSKVLSGLEILQEIRNQRLEIPVIVLSGQDSGNAVLELIKLGIEEYIIKEKDFIGRLKESVEGIFKKE